MTQAIAPAPTPATTSCPPLMLIGAFARASAVRVPQRRTWTCPPVSGLQAAHVRLCRSESRNRQQAGMCVYRHGQPVNHLGHQALSGLWAIASAQRRRHGPRRCAGSPALDGRGLAYPSPRDDTAACRAGQAHRHAQMGPSGFSRTRLRGVRAAGPHSTHPQSHMRFINGIADPAAMTPGRDRPCSSARLSGRIRGALRPTRTAEVRVATGRTSTALSARRGPAVRLAHPGPGKFAYARTPKSFRPHGRSWRSSASGRDPAGYYLRITGRAR
jgi:hypothetical protein